MSSRFIDLEDSSGAATLSSRPDLTCLSSTTAPYVSTCPRCETDRDEESETWERKKKDN